MLRPVVTVATCLLLGGCASTVAGFIGESLGVPLRSKVVRSKVEPNVLVAVDASSCQVPSKRWEEAEVGKPFLCTWSGPVTDYLSERPRSLSNLR